VQAKINLLYTSDCRMYFCSVHYSFSGALPRYLSVLLIVKQIMLCVTGTGARIN